MARATDAGPPETTGTSPLPEGFALSDEKPRVEPPFMERTMNPEADIATEVTAAIKSLHVVETTHGPHGVGYTVTDYGPRPEREYAGWRQTNRRRFLGLDSAAMRNIDPEGKTWAADSRAPWIDHQ